MQKLIIIVLVVVVLGVLFYGMKYELGAPDPQAEPTYNTILRTIHGLNQPCDRVTAFRRLGVDRGWVFYRAACADGGRYLYLRNPGEDRVHAISCQEAAQHGWYCPE